MRYNGVTVYSNCNLHAISISMADEVILDGEVLQQPTTPVVKATNMKKKATMKRAIMARPISEIIVIKKKIYFFCSCHLRTYAMRNTTLTFSLPFSFFGSKTDIIQNGALSSFRGPRTKRRQGFRFSAHCQNSHFFFTRGEKPAFCLLMRHFNMM